MLLAIDIGNTNITLGVFDDRELLGKFRMTTMMSRTSDEYGITLRELLRNQNMNPDEIDAVIVASVVPDIMHSFSSAIIKYFGHKPVPLHLYQKYHPVLPGQKLLLFQSLLQ